MSTTGPIQHHDVVVSVGDIPPKDFLGTAFGPNRRVIDSKGLLHFMQTSQSD